MALELQCDAPRRTGRAGRFRVREALAGGLHRPIDEFDLSVLVHEDHRSNAAGRQRLALEFMSLQFDPAFEAGLDEPVLLDALVLLRGRDRKGEGREREDRCGEQSRAGRSEGRHRTQLAKALFELTAAA